MGDGLWWLDPQSLLIYRVPEDAPGIMAVTYQVELERLTQSAEVLDAILHEDGSFYPDQDQRTLSLLRGLNRILRPQEGMCSGGEPGKLSGRELRRRVKQFVEGRLEAG